MVLPIGLMCCQHQHLGYLPIFGCIGCVQHHVGNVAIGERLFALVQVGSEPLRPKGKYFPHFVQLFGVSSVNNEVMARCGKLTGTSLPDSACCTSCESNFSHGYCSI